jgi:hypothetical protein
MFHHIFPALKERSSRIDASTQSDATPVSTPNPLQRELAVLKNLILEHDRTSQFLSDARSLLRMTAPRIIQVLHVKPEIKDNCRCVVNLESEISVALRNKPNLFIEITPVGAHTFPGSRFADPAYLRARFDMVFVGGANHARDGLRDLTKSVIENSLAGYHKAGGSVLFGHDTAWEFDANAPKWSYFTKELALSHEYPWGRTFTRVQRKVSSDGALAILTEPFHLTEPFTVGNAHGRAGCSTTVLIGSSAGSTYYAENNGIALCEIGHTASNIPESECQFLVNVICHLSELRRTPTE